MAWQDYYPGKILYFRMAALVLWFLSFILSIVSISGYLPSFCQGVVFLLAVYFIVMTIVFAMSCIPFSGVAVLVDFIVCLVAGGLSLILAIVDLASSIGAMTYKYCKNIDNYEGPSYGPSYDNNLCKGYKYAGPVLLIDVFLYVAIVVLCGLIAFFEFKSAPGGLKGLCPGGQGGEGGAPADEGETLGGA